MSLMRRKENMKNKEEFKQWCDEDMSKAFVANDMPKLLLRTRKRAWEACENMYESRRCEDCKRFSNMKIEQVDINDRESINEVRACQYTSFYNVPNNFSCKHWESKTA